MPREIFQKRVLSGKTAQTLCFLRVSSAGVVRHEKKTRSSPFCFHRWERAFAAKPLGEQGRRPRSSLRSFQEDSAWRRSLIRSAKNQTPSGARLRKGRRRSIAPQNAFKQTARGAAAACLPRFNQDRPSPVGGLSRLAVVCFLNGDDSPLLRRSSAATGPCVRFWKMHSNSVPVIRGSTPRTLK